MAIKAADTLKPNGSFALAEAADIDINGQTLTDYLANLSAGKGEKGTGIESITAKEVEGGTTVTITLDDKASTETVFTIKNGHDGTDGTGIKSVTSEAVSGGNSVTVTLNDAEETKTVFTVLDGQPGGQGARGPQGVKGTGIKSVTTEAVENGTSVTVTLDDDKETKTVFTVRDGEDGQQGTPGKPGVDGSSAHIVQTITTDDDGAEHVYIKTWVGDDEASAVTSPDLMAPVNEVLAAVEEIMGSYTGSATE